MASLLKSKSDDSDLCIFLFSGLIAVLYLGIHYDIPWEFVLVVLFMHILGGAFVWREVEQWFVFGYSWRRGVLVLLSLFVVSVLLCFFLSSLSHFLYYFLDVLPEKSAFLWIIVSSWMFAGLWSLLVQANL